jgi:hypothetical protein
MPEVSLDVLAFQKIFRLLAVSAIALPIAALAAAPITGTVTNKTVNKPSAGDEVVLIRLAQGMQESTRTTTDARGHYSLVVPDDGLHLIRVTHDKANYFQPAPAGTTTVDIEVYNASAHVKGVSTEAVVMRLQTDAGGANLRVVENFFVKNDSTPPMTQFSNEPFDFHLPEGAVIEGSAAQAANGMPVRAAPVPLPEKGLYTFLFPIRPGETRFQVSYSLPYTGKLSIDPGVTGPTDTVAVMMPKSMTFTPAAGSPYSAVNDEVNAQTFVARTVTVGQPMSFELGGKGELPRDAASPGQQDGQQQGAQQGANSDGTLAATDNKAPGKGLDNPLDPEGNRDPLAKYKWWILGILGVLLAAAAGILLRKPATPVIAAGGTADGPLPPVSVVPISTHELLLQVLKDELFSLETDRLQQRITEEDYVQQKAALELILRRALQRVQA